MATVSVLPGTDVRVKLNLPPLVVAEYERQAKAYGVTFEEILASRLSETVDFTSLKPIYIGDDWRKRFEALLGRNLHSVSEFFREAQKAVSIRVDEVHVALPQDVRTRIASRNLDKTVTYKEHVSRIVRRLLQEYVGR